MAIRSWALGMLLVVLGLAAPGAAQPLDASVLWAGDVRLEITPARELGMPAATGIGDLLPEPASAGVMLLTVAAATFGCRRSRVA